MSAISCHSSLHTALEKAREMLLAERAAKGHWIGELAASALSTATAISALSIVDRETGATAHQQLVRAACDWLLGHQNADGGWGDTTDSVSNISTTILVRAAFRLADRVERSADGRAASYVDSQGGYAGVQRRYGRDKTFAVPILTNAALAELIEWRNVSALPFELSVFPQSWYRLLQMPVVSYAIPALVAIGQARYFHWPPRNPLTKLMRHFCVGPSLKVLSRMQPESGGYLEAIPLTSFVLMSLAATGRARHRVSQQAISFLESTVRPDGSWPIDTNLATWNTTLAMNGLGTRGWDWRPAVDWLLSCQHNQRHPFTGSPPGGWGWTDLSGAVPDADDTPGALLALHEAREAVGDNDELNQRLVAAAKSGIEWLLNLQNRDGGWPTFCRGWGKLPFDRSGCDLTAHALRAIFAWRSASPSKQQSRIDRAIVRGRAYLRGQQRKDGSWLPLWFGNQFQPDDENPIYGTSRVLLAYAKLGWQDTTEAERARRFLIGRQNTDGGWGSVAVGTAEQTNEPSSEGGVADKDDVRSLCEPPRHSSGVEETSVALEGLIRATAGDKIAQPAIQNGLSWLVEAVHSGKTGRASPIGLYFAKLWYHERLYPLTFAVSALRAASECSGGPD